MQCFRPFMNTISSNTNTINTDSMETEVKETKMSKKSSAPPTSTHLDDKLHHPELLQCLYSTWISRMWLQQQSIPRAKGRTPLCKKQNNQRGPGWNQMMSLWWTEKVNHHPLARRGKGIPRGRIYRTGKERKEVVRGQTPMDKQLVSVEPPTSLEEWEGLM